MIIEMIVLTKSEKLTNYCVAGIKTDDGSWIRLENENVDGFAMSLSDITYADGSLMKELDVISVECEKAPDTAVYENLEIKYQPENYYINTSIKISKTRTSSWVEVLRLHPAEVKNYILASNVQSMTLDKANNLFIPKSLQLVHVKNLVIGTRTQNNNRNHPKAEFDYLSRDNNLIHYKLTVTDLDYKDTVEELKYDDAYLVISLGMPFCSEREPDIPKCYLLIAKIFFHNNMDQIPEDAWE